MRRGIAWALLLLLPLGAGTGRAAGADPATDAAAAKKIATLRTRVREWCDVRKQIVSRCEPCGGAGRIRRIHVRGGDVTTEWGDCPDCVDGERVNETVYRRAWFETHTPAWRTRPENLARFEEWLANAKRNPPRYRLRDASIEPPTLRGARCGTVPVVETGAASGVQVYAWILATEKPGGIASWYLYDAEADGDCDEAPPGPAAPGPPAPPKPPKPKATGPESARDLTPEELAAAAQALAKEGARATLRSGERRGDVLVLRVKHAGLSSEEELKAAIDEDIVPAMKAAMGAFPDAPSVRVEFLTCWRDRLGNVEARPYEAVSMDRGLFEKIHFENLDRDEQLDLFRREAASHGAERLILWWKGDCADAVAPGPVPAPPPKAGAPTSPAHAVSEALRWLAAHQSPDGRWESRGFSRWCDGKSLAPTVEGVGKEQYDVGVTGLALLAFVRAGGPEGRASPYGHIVADAVRFLVRQQDSEGCFAPRTHGHFVYNHAIAALAVVEAYGKGGTSAWRGPAQRGLDFIAAARNPNFAWRYGVRPGDNDTSVTGWMVTALKSAALFNAADERAGRAPAFALDPNAFAGVRAFIEKMTDPESGRVGYQVRGSGPARPTELVDKFPHERSEAMTAAGVLARFFVGGRPETDEAIVKGAGLCADLLPVWNPNDGSIDMYYWYYATAALKRVGGPLWRSWRSAMLRVAENSQVSMGDVCGTRGSWDPVDPWGADGGRVYSTAIMALILLDCAE